MTSLRRRLLVWLWLALILVGSASAAFAYLHAGSEADELLDYQMAQVAQFVAAQSFTAAAPAAIDPQLDFDQDAEDDLIVTVRDPSGQVLYASRPGAPLPALDWLGLRTLPLGGRAYRVFSAQSGGRRIVVAQQIETRREAAAAAAWSALLPVGLMLPVLGLMIGLVIRRQLRPLPVVAAEIARRPPLALEPLPVAGLPGEIRPLIDEINRLLARQRDAIQREQRFIADAAHALRTPLAALQLQSDVLEGSPDPVENAARRGELRAGIRRAVRLADHLLALALSEPAAGAVAASTDLDAALAEACGLYQPAAAARQVKLDLCGRCGAVVPGDARHLALLVGGLLDNALRYTPAGGRVVMSTRVDDEGTWLQVLDEGPGLAEPELEKVFERFYRARGDETEGSGLGLAVVRSVTEQLGGRVRLENRADRSGLIAQIWLPRPAAAPPGTGS